MTQLMQILDALSSACSPRSQQEALVLACHAAFLLHGTPHLVPLSSTSRAAPLSFSLLDAFHEASAGYFPTQYFAVYKAGTKDSDSQDMDYISIKPIRCRGSSHDYGGSEGSNSQHLQTGPVLVLFGYRGKLHGSAVHRLELVVGEYIVQEPDFLCITEREASGRPLEKIGTGDKNYMNTSENICLIRGEHGNSDGASAPKYACRFQALVSHIAVRFFSKLVPELYTVRSLPAFTEVIGRCGGRGNGCLKQMSSSSTPSLLVDELLPFLDCQSMLHLAATAWQFHRPLALTQQAWIILLVRDFPLADSSSFLRPATSRSSEAGPHLSAKGARGAYRRQFQARFPPKMLRHEGLQEHWVGHRWYLPPIPGDFHTAPIFSPLYYFSEDFEEVRRGRREALRSPFEESPLTWLERRRERREEGLLEGNFFWR